MNVFFRELGQGSVYKSLYLSTQPNHAMGIKAFFQHPGDVAEADHIDDDDSPSRHSDRYLRPGFLGWIERYHEDSSWSSKKSRAAAVSCENITLQASVR